MVETFTWIIKNVKKHLPTILNKIAELFIVTSLGVIFFLMMGFLYLMDSIQESYVYLFKGKLVTRPRSCWITFLTLLKIGIKRLPKKVVWPEISLKVTRVKPFVNFNGLIMNRM